MSIELIVGLVIGFLIGVTLVVLIDTFKIKDDDGMEQDLIVFKKIIDDEINQSSRNNKINDKYSLRI